MLIVVGSLVGPNKSTSPPLWDGVGGVGFGMGGPNLHLAILTISPLVPYNYGRAPISLAILLAHFLLRSAGAGIAKRNQEATYR